MEIEHSWSAILALLVGISFTIAFYGVMETFVTAIENPGKMFLAIIAGLTFARLALFIPIKQMTQDDRGNAS